VEISEDLNLLKFELNSNQRTFLNTELVWLRKKMHESNFGSRTVNLDRFIKEMDKCKSCLEGKHASQASKMWRRLHFNFKILTEITHSKIEKKKQYTQFVWSTWPQPLS